MRNKDIRFILKDAKSDKPTPVYLKYSCVDIPMKYSTGLKIDPREWDEEIQRPKHKKAFIELYNRIEELSVAVNKFLKANPKPQADKLYNYLINATDDNKKAERLDFEQLQKIKEQISLFTEIDQAIETAKNTIVKGKEEFYKPGTIRNWNCCKNHLMAFNPNLSYELILQAEVKQGDKVINTVYNDFLVYCNKEGFKKFYKDRLIKDWKKIMNLINKPLPASFERFRREKAKGTKHYISDAEIVKLMDYKELNDMEKVVRDSFIVNLENGLRISDMLQLTEDHIKEDVIILETVKTGSTTAIPLSGRTKRIMKEYKGLPRQYNSVMVNRMIKDIAAKAGLSNPEEITNHTARRSFITNKIKAGISIKDISEMLGVSQEMILEIYDQTTAIENAKQHLKHKAFDN